MLNLLLYEAKVALLLAVFYICYRVLLSRETLHRLNRVVLTGSVLVSFLLPFCVLTFHRTVELAAGAAAPTLSELPSLPLEPAAIAASPMAAQAAASTVNWWPVALVLLYVAGIAAFLIRLTVDLFKISRIIRSGEQHPQEDGMVLVIVDRDIAPFSWMKWIVVSRQDCDNRHILQHERAHIRLGHARDLLVINLLSAMQWFNPVMRMLKEDLRAVYEYEADDAVLREGANIKEYQYSLIRKAVSASGYSITNSFNHSILKNRITMMSKTKSGTWRGLRALYVLPLIGAVLACNAQTVTDYKVSENPQETKVDKHDNVVRLDLKKDADGNVQYYVNGSETAFDGIRDAVLATWSGDGSDLVSIYSEPDIDYGYVDDVKNVLRGIKALKIMYTRKKGAAVSRRLPPSREAVEAVGGFYDDNPLAKVSRDNICIVRINSADRAIYSTADGQLIVATDDQAGLDQFIADAAAAIRQLGRNGIFSFQCDRGTSYETYVAYQDALMSAYNTVREEYAMETFNKSMDALSEEERASVLWNVPVNIYEAETKNGRVGR